MVLPEFRPEIAAVAARQHGVVLRRQVLAAGYTPVEVRRLVGSGEWLTIRRGAYTRSDTWMRGGEHVQWWLRDVAAHLTMTKAHALSHDSAARALGLPMLHPRVWLSHVTRAGVLGCRTEYGVRHHLGRQPPLVLDLDGIPVTGLARTGLDMAREHGFKAGVVVLDECMRRGAPEREFVRELALMRSWPGVQTARAAYAFADRRAESPGESLLRILVAEMGVGDVEPQFAVALSGRVVWADLRVGCHLFEFDGRSKYTPLSEGGFAQASPTEVVWAEKLRERELGDIGLGMSRVVWDDLMGPSAWLATQRRLHADYRATVQRLGRSLPPHLAEFAHRNPRPIPDSRGAVATFSAF